MTHTDTLPDQKLWWESTAQPALPAQPTYTADQVAHLLALAYESGRHTALTESMADTWRSFEANWRGWRRTAAQVLADRRADIDAGAARASQPYVDYVRRDGKVVAVQMPALTSPKPYTGGPVAWETAESIAAGGVTR